MARIGSSRRDTGRAVAWTAGILMAVLACGCKDTTYTYPTETWKFRSREAGPVEQKAFRDSAKDFEARVAKFQTKETGNWAVAPMGLYQSTIVLLSGSEDAAFETLSAVLGAKEVDPFALSQGLSDWLGRTGPGADLKCSFWTVQPVLMQSGFASDMAEHFRADVLKLGSKGIYATRELDKWSVGASGRPVEIKLETSMTAVLVSAAGLDLTWKSPMRLVRDKFDGVETDFLVATGDWQVVAGQGGNELVVPVTNESVELRVSTDQPLGTLRQASLAIPAVSWSASVDVGPLLRGLGGADLFKFGNNFHSISVELNDGMVSEARQVMAFTFTPDGIRRPGGDPVMAAATSGETGLKFDRPFAYRVVHRETGLALVSGRFVVAGR